MQLVLPVLHSHDYSLKNFIAGSNTSLLEHLQQQLSSTLGESAANPITFVHGLHGAGKTHLLSACHQIAEANSISCQYLDMHELVSMPAPIIQDIGLLDSLFIDNIDAIANQHAWQVQIFDTINQFLEHSGKCLLFSSSKSVVACQFSLPDLASRLMWGTTFHLQELDESEKVLAIKKHFNERGISVQQEVILFLMNRSHRDMHKLMQLVERLDSLSLQSKRKLTIPFIKQALSI
ncbi:DnaA regulatory inactivator Hda [Glaciecola sp. SC05]|uniref:DnaA regulatory inactivator Hda n=1 Tax=Glaciecola sp. SC05 TaxID=1987355 RepID=UPI003527DCE0